MEAKCDLGLEVLDFRPHYPCFNMTDTSKCEIYWPCELRHFWLNMHTFVEVTRGFLSYGTITIIVIGMFLNTISFYILVSSGLTKNGSGLYLIALIVCDCGNLLTNYAIGVARGQSPHFNKYFMEFEWLCRFHGVFVEIFQMISAWIVVGFTVERCLAVWYPLVFRGSKIFRSKIVVGSLSTVFAMFSFSKLFLTGFEKDSVFGYAPCYSGRYVWQGMAHVRVAFQTWIPTVIVFVFNCLMFWKLRKIKLNRKRLTACRKDHNAEIDRSRSNQSNASKKSFIHRPSPTTPMLITVSLAYLILVFPLGLVQTIELYWNVHARVPVATVGEAREHYVHWMKIRILIKYIRSFCFGFYQLNFAINFFLYFASGVQFRVHLVYKIHRLVRLCGFGNKVADFDSRERSGTVSTGVYAATASATLMNNLPLTTEDSPPLTPQNYVTENHISNTCHVNCIRVARPRIENLVIDI